MGVIPLYLWILEFITVASTMMTRNNKPSSLVRIIAYLIVLIILIIVVPAILSLLSKLIIMIFQWMVETVFSVIKRRFGDRIKSRSSHSKFVETHPIPVAYLEILYS